MPLVATLIANPADAVLSREIAERTRDGIGAEEINWLAVDIACDILFPPDNNTANGELYKSIHNILADQPIDIIIQKAETRRKKALIADMDSTMIEQECIDELAAVAGIKPQIAQITARAMNGEIEFETALRERMLLLAGLKISVIDDVLENQITLTPGGKTLVATMKSNGAYCALVSGGFTAFTDIIAGKLGFDENRANILLEENGELTGKVAEPILGQQAKVDALTEIAETHNLTPADFLAVGDGANDLGMLGVAGTGVALHAKPAVASQAEFRIDHGDLTALLYIQGYSRNEFVT
ncbi:MAG: phosphoserine phosphatase SerB [Rhizobiaceae bacterium]|nr:phosphoserine phosphatase SerB [Rhizobiaceae bacterium]